MMDAPVIRIFVLLAALTLALALAGVVWLSAVVAWGDRHTAGLAYFGRRPQERARFRRQVRFHARLLAPIIRMVSRASPFTFGKASFEYRGVAGPKGTCTVGSFRSGAEYAPTSQDVFVVTQMRSGTTWMQHLVYQVLMRGGGDLVESGRTLGAVSPWLEAVIGVPLDRAPLLGAERPARVIKTHFPVTLCPYSAAAKYVYVVRHPVSCFASCVDFLRDDLGAASPSIDSIEAWFRSDRMWWGSWPSHVSGWWSRAAHEQNVLFVSFESMLADLPAVVAKVAAFLGVAPLGDEEMRAIDHKVGFDYMQSHKDAFEMYPPHVLAADSAYYERGTADRHRDVPADMGERVARWCRDELADTPFPLEQLYPDLIGETAPRDSVDRAVSAPGG